MNIYFSFKCLVLSKQHSKTKRKSIYNHLKQEKTADPHIQSRGTEEYFIIFTFYVGLSIDHLNSPFKDLTVDQREKRANRQKRCWWFWFCSVGPRQWSCSAGPAVGALVWSRVLTDRPVKGHRFNPGDSCSSCRGVELRLLTEIIFWLIKWT